MNWIDLVILIILFVFIVHGAVKGAVQSLVLFVSAFLSYRYASPFGAWLSDNVLPMFEISADTQGILLPIASFFVLLVIFWAIGTFVASLFKDGVLGFINHILGAGLGFVIAFALISIAISFGETNFLSPAKNNLDARKHSKFYYPMAKIGSDMLATQFRVEEIKIDVDDINNFSKDLKRLQGED